MLQPPADRLRRQQLDPRRGQLDRQRQAVKPPDDLGHRGGVPLVNGEPRRHGRCPLGKQPHRFRRSDRPGPALRLLIRDRQRGYRAFLLARHPKRRPAAHHDPKTPGPAQQFRHDRSGRQQVLEIVQHDQELPVAQVTHQVLHQRPVPRIRQSDALGHRGGHQSRIPRRRQRDEIHPVGIIACRARGKLNGKTRLAAATRPGQREQAAAGQQPPRLRSCRSRPIKLVSGLGRRPKTGVEAPARERLEAGVSDRGARHQISAR